MIRRVLVVGGAGFIGRHLMLRLLSEGLAVRCFDRVKPDWITADVEFFEGDFTATHQLEPAVAGIDAIFHLASTTVPQTSNTDPQFDVTSNLVATIGLLDLARVHGVRRFVFASSGGTIYGSPTRLPAAESDPTHPICSYGIVKLAIEKYLRMYHHLHGLGTCSLRIANPYGPFQRPDGIQGAVTIFTHKVMRNEAIEIWGDGSIVRDYIYIDDAIDALFKALRATCSGFEINVGSGVGVSLNALLQTIGGTVGRRPRVHHRAPRPFDVAAIWLDIALAKKLIAWQPSISIADGVRRLASHFQAADTPRREDT
jgi:UDP-glucose 4-epimerase